MVVVVMIVVLVIMPVPVLMFVLMSVMVLVVMLVFLLHVDVKLHAGDPGFFSARDMQVITIEIELLQLALEFPHAGAQIDQSPDEHVAADAAEDIQVEGFHAEKTSGGSFKFQVFSVQSRPVVLLKT